MTTHFISAEIDLQTKPITFEQKKETQLEKPQIATVNNNNRQDKIETATAKSDLTH